MSSYNFDDLCWNTGAGTSVIDRGKYMAEIIRESRVDLTTRTSQWIYKDHAVDTNIFPDQFRYPVIINVVGSGTCGKNTFSKLLADIAANNLPGIHEVDDLSVIDDIPAVVETLIDTTFKAADVIKQYHRGEMPYNIATGESVARDKGDEYRQFLHDVKDAWSKYYDGPVLTTILRIINICDHSVAYLKACNGKPSATTSIIFVQNRDADTVARMEKACSRLGLICLTMGIGGHETPDWKNDCDSKVGDITTDFYIDNSGTLGDLSQKILAFVTLFHIANSIYGVRHPDYNPVSVDQLWRNITCQSVPLPECGNDSAEKPDGSKE